MLFFFILPPLGLFFWVVNMTGYLEAQGGTDKLGGKQVVHDVEDPHPASVPTFRAASPDDGQIVTQLERQSLIRGLSQRHVQMIAIAGAIVCSY